MYVENAMLMFARHVHFATSWMLYPAAAQADAN